MYCVNTIFPACAGNVVLTWYAGNVVLTWYAGNVVLTWYAGNVVLTWYISCTFPYMINYKKCQFFLVLMTGLHTKQLPYYVPNNCLTIQRMPSFSKYKLLQLTVCYQNVKFMYQNVFTYTGCLCIHQRKLCSNGSDKDLWCHGHYSSGNIVSCVLHCVVMSCFRYRHDLNKAYEIDCQHNFQCL